MQHAMNMQLWMYVYHRWARLVELGGGHKLFYFKGGLKKFFLGATVEPFWICRTFCFHMLLRMGSRINVSWRLEWKPIYQNCKCVLRAVQPILKAQRNSEFSVSLCKSGLYCNTTTALEKKIFCRSLLLLWLHSWFLANISRPWNGGKMDPFGLLAPLDR